MAYSLLIDGKLTEGEQALDVINPATGEAFARCARASVGQLDQAVAAARAAFPGWAARDYSARRAALEAFAAAIAGRAEEVARTLTLEQGKPLDQARSEVRGAIGVLRYFARQTLETETLRDDERRLVRARRVPLGVVAAILPWNYPVVLLMLRIAPALIAGNSVVAKPAPTTPLTTLLLGEIAAPLLPPGVLNVVVDADDLGDRLTGYPDVAKISFTGSTATGRKVMASAASGLKRLTLELGGNDAAIVLDDADIDTVAPAILASAMENAGQICMATKRVYAPAPLHDRLCDALAAFARDMVVDDGLAQGAQLGPLQNAAQFAKVREYLAEAHARGTVLSGGAALDRPGYFVAPTIVRDMPDDSRLVREEQFGPVLPVLHYDDLDEAICRANDSDYGLAGSVWTSNPERGLAVAERIETGTVWINHALDLPPDIPGEGAKLSGFGGDELAGYTRLKVVNLRR